MTEKPYMIRVEEATRRVVSDMFPDDQRKREDKEKLIVSLFRENMEFTHHVRIYPISPINRIIMAAVLGTLDNNGG